MPDRTRPIRKEICLNETELNLIRHMGDRRIYDRILETCVPIRFDGESFRKGSARHNLEKASRLLRD